METQEDPKTFMKNLLGTLRICWMQKNVKMERRDMVLLHHEVEVEFPDGRPMENHYATLLEFGRTKDRKTTIAMGLTVGIPAAIGALVL
ncbi:alpha-aminoadipic semialdehyde synthase-like [Magnolia sinica]|uniref:alpha-aminoadipic semialdehyde synthase-like n=1 Tax=Magnolia sinica TaxID=86752 RepID=UPI00265B5AF5|nr:alpha-aminoadipic semialdehyde synthase-like [Magnolia sinica]